MNSCQFNVSLLQPIAAVTPTDVVEVPCVSMDAETSQIHLLPVLVDTSLVEGLIAEVICLTVRGLITVQCNVLYV